MSFSSPKRKMEKDLATATGRATDPPASGTGLLATATVPDPDPMDPTSGSIPTRAAATTTGTRVTKDTSISCLSMFPKALASRNASFTNTIATGMNILRTTRGARFGRSPSTSTCLNMSTVTTATSRTTTRFVCQEVVSSWLVGTLFSVELNMHSVRIYVYYIL